VSEKLQREKMKNRAGRRALGFEERLKGGGENMWCLKKMSKV